MSKALKDAIEANDPEAVKKAAKGIKDWSRKLPKAEAPPLAYALRQGAEAVIDPLLDAGALVWEGGYEGNHPICMATDKYQPAIIRKIASRGVPPKVLSHALFIAACYGKTECVRALLETSTPQFTHRTLEVTTWWTDGQILELFLVHGADINQPNTESSNPDDFGRTIMHYAASNGIVRPIELIASHGGNLNARDAHQRTPLMVLAGRFPELQEDERIRDQIAKSRTTGVLVIPADPGRRTGDRGPSDCLAAARTLLRLGADATLKDRFGNDALAYYESARRLDRTGIDESLVALLKKAGAAGGGPTARLFAALRQDSVADAYKAIDDGADVNHQSPPPWGYTPLVGARSTEMVELLLEKGADPNRHSIGQTPLIVAAQGHNLDAVKLLVQAGADIHAIQPRPPKSEYLANAYSLSKGPVQAYLKSLGAGKPILPDWEPLTPGVGMWENFSEVVAKAEVSAVARTVARIIQGKVTENAYGKEFKPGEKSFVVLRPKGMAWSNLFQISPPPKRFESIDQKFLASLAQEIPAPVMLLEYSDTAGAGSMKHFNPDGTAAEDQSGDEEMLTEMVGAMGNEAPGWARDRLKKLKREKRPELDLQKLGEQEKYAIAWESLMAEDGKLEIAFNNLPAEAFDGVAWITT